jgi:hypothetical protein
MSQIDRLTEAGLKTPKAAAIAGVVFSLLTLTSFGLLWSAIPADQQASGAWLVANGNEIALALNLIPFAGIAFLWFLGVIRDQLGRREDRFFATVFLGSGLLFLGMLFVAAAVVGAMLGASGDEPAAFTASPEFRFARAVSSSLVNIYMVKMAGVFMISNLDGRDVDAFRAALAGRTRLSAGGLAACRQLVPPLEFRALSPVGAPPEHPFPGGQCSTELSGLRSSRAASSLDELSKLPARSRRRYEFAAQSSSGTNLYG